LIKIDVTLLDALTNEASRVERRRKNYNFHTTSGDLMQRMLNAFEPYTYVRPHRHLDLAKREVFIVLRGKCAVIFYNDIGDVKSVEILDASQGKWGLEISPDEWHAIISLAYGTVVYELKDGPYEAMTDKSFAAWAPKEGDKDVDEYLIALMEQLGLGIEKNPA
jgi:cupin fold WbuC family metalloprotein